MSKKSDPRDGARTATPEKAVVRDPPPEPDYPRYRVEPGEKLSLAEVDSDATEHYRRKKDVAKELEAQRRRIRYLQERLYAENRRGLLIVLQAMDTGGKDGTIKHVFEGINPQGCRVSSFKVPSAEEANHDFLWRYHKSVLAKGRIGIFNRSHYEDVLVVRVKNFVPEEVWRPRYGIINDFERTLGAGGITVLKFFLHISKDEQKKRLQARLDNPEKRWKFSSNDIKERAFWDAYQAAYEDAINNCSTQHAPWYVPRRRPHHRRHPRSHRPTLPSRRRGPGEDHYPRLGRPVYVQNNGYRISTDPSELHLSVIHGYLERSYWAAGIPEEVVRRSIENSLCFGVYRDTEQVGFARVVTDRATFAYLADVFVLEEHRGRGIGKWLVEAILSHPDLQGLRRWMLATRDAHELYRRYGFSELGRPEIFMEIVSPYVAEIDPDPDALDP